MTKIGEGGAKALRLYGLYLFDHGQRYIGEVLIELAEGRVQALDGAGVEDLRQRGIDLATVGRELLATEAGPFDLTRQDLLDAAAAVTAEKARTAAVLEAARLVDALIDRRLGSAEPADGAGPRMLH